MSSRAAPPRVRSFVNRIGQRRQVVLPKSLCDSVGVVEGDLVEVRVERGRITIVPKRLETDDGPATQTDAASVRRGLKESRAGTTRPWRAVKDELGL